VENSKACRKPAFGIGIFKGFNHFPKNPSQKMAANILLQSFFWPKL